VAASARDRVVVVRGLLGTAAAVLAAAVVLAASGCGTPRDAVTSSPSPVVTSPSPEYASPGPAASPLAAAIKPPGALSVTAFGAAGDGTADDTAAVLAALQAATAKGVAVWFPQGTYAVGDVVVPNGAVLAGLSAQRSWLAGRVSFGGDSRISDLRIGRDGAATRFTNGAANTVFRRAYFVGGGGVDSGEDQGVIRFSPGRSAADIHFVACTVGANSANGNGVSIVSYGRADATYHDISWEHCRFLGSPRMNLEVIQRPDGGGPMDAGYRHIDLLDCDFEPSGSESVSYDAIGTAGDCTISGCTFYGAGWNGAYPYGQGIEFNGATSMRFVGNTVYRCRGAMINHKGTVGVDAGTVIKDNVFDGTKAFIKAVPDRAAQTIYLSGVSGARFAGNEVRTNVGGELMYLDEASGNVFSGNAWTDLRPHGQAYACAVLTDFSTGNVFTGDRFETAAGDVAVLIRNGSQATTFRSCLFVLPAARQTGGTTGVAADPGLSVTITGGGVQP
jgi:hypothetical protein